MRKKLSPYDETKDELIGAVLPGDIKLISLIGDGGMGSVYQARQITLDRNVAVKVMHGNLLSNSKAINRFNQEAHAAARLDHPNIVKVHDFRADESGLCFLVMDLIEGVPLSKILRTHGAPALSPQRAINILCQVCDALQHAHSKGVVHRDLKPSNIMVASDQSGADYVRVLDFGIAKILPREDSERLKLTQTGEIFGSPLYMSPEQCKGNPLDHRSDIYSMGCMMFECLTGKPPLEGANAFETLCKHTTDLPPSIKTLRADIEYLREFDAIVLKAMAKNPAERYQSMLELKADLKKIGKDQRETWFNVISNEAKIVHRKIKATKKGRLIPYTMMSVLGAVALTFFSAHFLLHEARELSWDQYYVQAQQAFDNGDYSKAKDYFEQALRRAGPDKAKSLAALTQITDMERAQGLPWSDYDGRLRSYEQQQAEPILAELSSLDKKFQAMAVENSNDSTKKLEDMADAINDKVKQVQITGTAKSRSAMEQTLTLVAKTLSDRKLTANTGYARSLFNLAIFAQCQQQNGAALELFKKAAEAGKQCVKDDPTNVPIYLYILDRYAHAYRVCGKAEDSERILMERLKASRQASSNNFGFFNNPNVARSNFLLAEHYLTFGDVGQANERVRDALRCYEKIQDVDKREKADCYALLGLINLKKAETYQAEKKFEMMNSKLNEAEQSFDSAKTIYETQQEQASGFWLRTLMGLADIHFDRKDFKGAEPLYRRALGVGLRSVPRQSQYVEGCIRMLKEILNRNGNSGQPEGLKFLLRTQLQMDIIDHGPGSKAVIEDYKRLSDAARRNNEMQLAASYLDKAIESCAKVSWERLDMLVARALVQFDSRQLVEGRKSFEEAVGIAENLKLEAPQHIDSLRSLESNMRQRLKDSPELIERAARLTTTENQLHIK